MERRLEGLVAVVTGGGRGIGRAWCERLAHHGARVVVNDAGVGPRGDDGDDDDPAAEVVAALTARGHDAVAHHGDVAADDSGEQLLDLALHRWGRCDIVVANAGFGRPRMAFNLSIDDWDAVIGVHLRGTFAVARPVLAHWRSIAKRDGQVYGRLITTATGLLVYGGAGQSNYVAAKAGVVAFTESVATEMAPYGVTANAIMPSANTRLAQIGWRMARNAQRARDGGVDFDPSDPIHVAEFGCYLASPAAHFVSGQTFQVRGGTIEHVATFAVDRTITRDDRGFELDDLVGDVPRMFGAGPRRADPPPPEWRKPE